jgi:hypothetical protein
MVKAVGLDHVCLVIEPTNLDAIARLGPFRRRQRAGSALGARGEGRSLYVLDPDGNVVELRQYS